jgi:hypothetical protein
MIPGRFRNRLSAGLTMAALLALPAMTWAAIDLEVIPSATTGAPGSDIKVEVRVAAASALTASPAQTSFRIVMNFNSPDPILDFVGTEVCTPAGVVFPVGTTPSSGLVNATQASYSAAAATHFLGSGCLIRFKFKVKATATPGQSSYFDVDDGPAGLSEFRTTAAVRTDVNALTMPAIAVPYPVRGNVTYWKNCPAYTVRIPEVIASIKHGATLDDSDISDALTGDYELDGIPDAVAGSPSTLHFNRVNVEADFTSDTDVKAAIDGADVALVMNYYNFLGLAPWDLSLCQLDAAHCQASITTPFSGYVQRIAADVDEDGFILGSDGSTLLQLIGQPHPGAAATLPL